ncbi:MAG: hypothetical protein RH949_13335 [Coleofasciculus sp. A1-SPW-01]|uniref:hypothetical protein n=1 Tax=Coleofasciculus sp. A1-SPW-01 TaxID=3070819 RepID=UPI0032F54442
MFTPQMRLQCAAILLAPQLLELNRLSHKPKSERIDELVELALYATERLLSKIEAEYNEEQTWTE